MSQISKILFQSLPQCQYEKYFTSGLYTKSRACCISQVSISKWTRSELTPSKMAEPLVDLSTDWTSSGPVPAEFSHWEVIISSHNVFYKSFNIHLFYCIFQQHVANKYFLSIYLSIYLSLVLLFHCYFAFTPTINSILVTYIHTP